MDCKTAKVTEKDGCYVIEAKGVSRNDTMNMVDLFKTSAVTFLHTADGIIFETDNPAAVKTLVRGLRAKGFEISGKLGQLATP